MYGYWFGMNPLWWLFWGIVIVAFFSFVTPVPRRAARPPVDPLDVLKGRYAAGELDTAEYDERRARLLDTPDDDAVAARTTRVGVAPRPPTGAAAGPTEPPPSTQH